MIYMIVSPAFGARALVAHLSCGCILRTVLRHCCDTLRLRGLSKDPVLRPLATARSPTRPEVNLEKMLSLLSISTSYAAPTLRSAVTSRAAVPSMQLQKKVRTRC